MIYFTGTDERGINRSGHAPATGWVGVIEMKYRQGWTTLTAKRNGVTLASITNGRLTFAPEAAR